MERPEIDRVELLRGLSADERARFLIEWGLEGDPDPEIKSLRRLAEGGTGEFSRRIGPDEKPPRRTREQWQKELRRERIYGKKSPLPRPEPEELPGTSHIDSPPQGQVADWKPAAGRCRNWATMGIQDHLERLKALEGKPYKPFSKDPFVTREQAAANTGNPFKDVVPTRWARLRLDEVARVYDAMAFMKYAFQRRVNAHLTIRWSAIGVEEADAPVQLHKFLNRAGKWFKQQKLNRGCVWAHTAQLPDALLWVYAHEKSATYGFHTHVLLSIDPTQCKAFREWINRCLALLVDRDEVCGDVTMLTRSYAKSEPDEDRAHWRSFKYITKQLDPDEEVESPFCDKAVPARQIFEPYGLRARLPVTVPRLIGVCRRLDRAAQNEAGFVSPLRQGLMLYDDANYRIPCLDEDNDRGCPVFEVAHGHERDYPGLDLSYLVPLGDRDVAGDAPHQYLAFETAWDRMTEAEQCWAAARGKKKAIARRILAEARANFEIAEKVINLDRWGLMPDVVYYEGSQRPKLRCLCPSAVWDGQLKLSNLKADAAYEWFQHIYDGAVVDIIPREQMPPEKRACRSKVRMKAR